MSDILRTADILETEGKPRLDALIEARLFGRGGNVGAHVVVGLGIKGRGDTLEAAITDWVREARGWGSASEQKEMGL